jgi:hypothetical protein
MIGRTAARRSAAERGRTLGYAHGTFNLVSGAWPIVHMRSFEAVFGPKADDWLVRTVAGLLMAIGWSQIRAAPSAEGQDFARCLGLGTAATLLAIDVIYVPKGRLSPTYLIDAVVEAAWIRAWLMAGRGSTTRRRERCRH